MDVLGNVRSTKPARSREEERRGIHQPAPSFADQAGGNDLLETGIKVIDLVCPFAKGGKVGLFGGAGVGKTVNMMELINVTSPRSTAVSPCSPAWVSVPVRATTSTTR